MFELFKQKSDGLLCPRCERPLFEHEEANCKRKMSRRFFLGATTGIVIAAALPTASANKAVSLKPIAPAPTAWFPGSRYMLSTKGGYFVTSLLDGMSQKAVENRIESTRSAGFDVIVAHNETAVRAEYHRQTKEMALLLNDQRYSANVGNGIDTIASFKYL